MDAELIASKKHCLFQSVKYSYAQIPADLFQTINTTDNISSRKFSVAITYDLKIKTVNSVFLEYNIDYLFANGMQSKIHMHASCLFYDFNSSFIEILGRNLDKLNDYHLAYNMPYFEQISQKKSSLY